MSKIIGVISDTHGLLRPEALAALAGSELIVHAGDIGKLGFIEALREIAPVVAIRGNIDYGELGRAYRATQQFEFGGRSFYVIHDRYDLAIDPAAGGFDVVISGHSHEPKIEIENGVTFFNPGSAGGRRFSLPVTVGRITIDENDLSCEIIDIDG